MAREPGQAEREECSEGWRAAGKKLIDAAWYLAGAADDEGEGDDAAEAREVFFGGAEPAIKEEVKTFGVLPSNVEVLGWFLRLQTQWRVSMNGAYGLDYGVFIMMAKDEGVKRSNRAWMLEDLQLMEREYLAAIRLKQAKASGTT